MNILDKIKALAFNEEVEAQFANAKSKDGSILQITPDVAVDAKVEVVNEDGTLKPIEGNEVVLEDGTVLKLDGGMITEIVMAEPVEEEQAKVEEPKQEDYSKRFEVIEEQVKTLFTAVEQLLEVVKSKSGEMSTIKKENQELKKVNQDLSNKASVAPANHKKFEKTIDVIIKTGKENDRLQRLEELRESKNKK